jgi:N-acetylmuramoyl-L-alanine amidase
MGFNESFSSDSERFTFKKGKMSVSVQTYNYFISVNAKIYRLKNAPYIQNGNIILSSGDKTFITNLIFKYHQKLFSKPSPEKKTEKIRSKRIPDVNPGVDRITRYHLSPSTTIDKIFIDPGHGGKDRGAHAYELSEKDLTLSVSRELQKSLKKRLKKTPIHLIRNKDKYLSLEERCNAANSSLHRNENGLFISIHFNSWFDPSINGFELYYLSHDTNSEVDRIKALNENKAFVTGVSLDGLTPIEKILGRFEVIQYQKESRRVAELITASVYKSINNYTVNRGIKSELFYVLKGTLMPAVLIEVGFISNLKDMEFLGKKENVVKLSDAIADGIEAYILDFKHTGGYRNTFLKF